MCLYVRDLNAHESRQLTRLLKSARSVTYMRRSQVVAFSGQGMRVQEIADRLFLHEDMCASSSVGLIVALSKRCAHDSGRGDPPSKPGASGASRGSIPLRWSWTTPTTSAWSCTPATGPAAFCTGPPRTTT